MNCLRSEKVSDTEELRGNSNGEGKSDTSASEAQDKAVASTREGEPSGEEERLTEDLRKEKEKSEGYLTRLKYLQADFENYRKQVVREISEAVLKEKERLVLELIGFKDDLSIALNEASSSDFVNPFVEGVKVIFRKLDENLRKEGLVEIEALGKPFDPHRHEAVGYTWDDKGEESMVCRELKKGYILGGKVIRPSVVEVYRTSPEKKEGE